MEQRHTTSPRKKKFMIAPSAGKFMVVVLWEDKRFYYYELLSRWKSMNSDCCNETLRRSPHMEEVCTFASPWRHHAANMCACYWGHHVFWMDGVATYTLPSWPRAISLLPVLGFTRCQDTITSTTDTAERHASVTTEEEKFLLRVDVCCFQRWRCRKRWKIFIQL